MKGHARIAKLVRLRIGPPRRGEETDRRSSNLLRSSTQSAYPDRRRGSLMQHTPSLSSKRLWRSALALTAVAAVLLAVPERADAAPNGYVTMSDGTSIAINVRMPNN